MTPQRIHNKDPRQQYRSLALLTISGILLSLLYCPPVDVFFDDKEIFKYAGMVLYKGGLPYRDFFDHKPPLIYFLHFFDAWLGPWAFWLIDTGMVLLATFVFWKACSAYIRNYAWIPPLLFNLLLRDHLISIGIGMTREYTAIFLLLFFCMTISTWKPRFLAMGLLAGLTFFMQQDQILPLLPWVGCALIQKRGPAVWQRLGAMTLGLLIAAVPILAFFALHKGLAGFWQEAFLFNFQWYSEKKSLLEHFIAIKNGLDAGNYEVTFITTTVFGISALFLRNSKKGLLLISLAGTLLAFSAEMLSGKLASGPAFYYYFLPLAAAMPITFFLVIAFTDEAFIRDAKARLIWFLICACSLVYTIFQHATHLRRPYDQLVQGDPAYHYLQQRQLKDHQVYVFQDNNFVRIYNQQRILAPSPWIYQHFWAWYPTWDPNNQKLKAIGDSLLSRHTEYLLDFSDSNSFAFPENYTFWRGFREKNYTRVWMVSHDKADSSLIPHLWQLRSVTP